MAQTNDLVQEYISRVQPPCPRCKYTLTSVQDATCSECGHTLSLELARSGRVALAFTRLIFVWAVLLSLISTAAWVSIEWESYQVIADLSREYGQTPEPFVHWMFSSVESLLMAMFIIAHMLPAGILLAWLIFFQRRLNDTQAVRWSLRICGVALFFYLLIGGAGSLF